MRAYFVRSPRQRRAAKRVQLAGSPPIITRAGWHADEAIRRAAPLYADAVQFAVVHHTAGSNAYTHAPVGVDRAGIEVYHVKGNGWNDIGYNFLVDKYGQIFEGRYGGIDEERHRRARAGVQHRLGRRRADRQLQLDGDHAGGAGRARRSCSPGGSTSRTSTRSRRSSAVSAATRSTGRARAVTLRAISGHRDTYLTSAPADALYALLPSIATRVAQTGLPKLYSPAVHRDARRAGALHGAGSPSRLPWTVTVTRSDARPSVASGTGIGDARRLDVGRDRSRPPGHYTWTISCAADARRLTGTIGSAPGAARAYSS